MGLLLGIEMKTVCLPYSKCLHLLHTHCFSEIPLNKGHCHPLRARREIWKTPGTLLPFDWSHRLIGPVVLSSCHLFSLFPSLSPNTTDGVHTLTSFCLDGWDYFMAYPHQETGEFKLSNILFFIADEIKSMHYLSNILYKYTFLMRYSGTKPWFLKVVFINSKKALPPHKLQKLVNVLGKTLWLNILLSKIIVSKVFIEQ